MKVTVTMEFASEAEAASFLSGKGGSTATATGKGTAETKTATETKPKSKHTRTEMQAALNEVKEKFEPAAAKAIIKSVGKVDKMADIPEDKIDAVFDACQEKMAEGGGSEDI